MTLATLTSTLISTLISTLAYQSIRHPLGQLLSIINKFAPLSVVIAALGFLNTLKQNSAKRNQDEAKSTREVLNKAGTKAYILNWSLIGNMEISSGVLQLREMIETRLGKTPTVQEFEALLADQPLIESMIEKAWRDSGAIAQFRQEALEFGQIRADLGDKIPLIQEALEIVATRLRLLFKIDTFVLYSFRKDPAYRSIARSATAKRPDPMTNLQRLFLRSVGLPKEGAFSEACSLLEQFSTITATAADKRILKLLKHRLHPLARIKDLLQQKQQDRLDQRFRQQFARQLNARLPAEAPLLCEAADEVLHRATRIRRTQQRLENSSNRIAHLFSGLSQSEDLADASKKFLAAHSADELRAMALLKGMLRLKYAGIPDPEIDLHLATGTGILELLKSADARGANHDTIPLDVLARHENTLSEDQDGWPALAAAARL